MDWKELADGAMDRYAQGNDEAFGLLYDTLAPRLYTFFLRRANAPDGAADLVQQTFLQMHNARGRFVRGSSAIAWAFAIGRHLLIDSSRRRGSQPMASVDDQEGSALRDHAPSVDSKLDAHRQLRSVRQEVDRLPDGQRAAFELVREQGLTIAEAADVLGLTANAVKVRVHRATEALRHAVGRKTDAVGAVASLATSSDES